MQVENTQLSPTTVKLSIVGDQAGLEETKRRVLIRLAQSTKVPGFRPGRAPLSLVERQVDSSAIQAEFLDEAIGRLYAQAVKQEKLRPIDSPRVSMRKFVPYSTLEFEVEVAVIGEVTLPDYRKLQLTRPTVTVTEKEVDEVIKSLRQRVADKREVTRAAKAGDEVTIDFSGKDAKTNEPIKGTDGKGYPLSLGSDTFIPGFETNLIGLKSGEQKTFTLTFPKDYAVAALKRRKVTFEATVTKVQEVTEPTIDDAFAAKVSPHATVVSLRADIERHLKSEKQRQADRDYEQTVLDKVATESKIAIPDKLIDEEIARSEQQLRQNLNYRGQTWQEYLKEIAQDEATYRTAQRDPAIQRVKAGLVLSEIAEREQITVTPDELKSQLARLREQYKDETMRAELEKPANVRNIMSNMLADKTLKVLTGFTAVSSTSKKQL